MGINEINETLDKVEEIANNDELLDIIASDQSTLERCVNVFNLIIEKSQEKENLPDPSGVGPCELE